MKAPLLTLAVASLAVTAYPTIRYVDANSATPTHPYTNWATATRVIQDAVDAAAVGDEIVVTNGFYAGGGRAVGTTLLANRVAVDKPLALRSVNGPLVTVISGSGGIRCAYLTNGASLSGFTLGHGVTQSGLNYFTPDQVGGGLWCESLSAVASNCVLMNNTAYLGGGGVVGGTLKNCTLSANRTTGYSANGGGASGSTLIDCTLTANSATGQYGFGGGAHGSTLYGCTLTANSAGLSGGGAAESSLYSCTLSSNTAPQGAGAYLGTLSDCTLVGNTSPGTGGGAWGSRLNNCVVSGNSASSQAGGTFYGILNACTLTGNSTGGVGGGAAYGTLNNCILNSNIANTGGAVFGSTLNNCTLVGNVGTNVVGGACTATVNNSIVYFNTAPVDANFNEPSVMNYCCTYPRPVRGHGHITQDPLFLDVVAGSLRLQSNSPCINGGNSDNVPAGPDADGQPRIVDQTVDIGAYEFQEPGVPTAPYIISQPANQTVAVGVDVTFQVRAFGTFPLSYQWRFKGLALEGATNLSLVITNVQLTNSGPITVVISNVVGATTSNPALLAVNLPTIHYVDLNGTQPTAPHTNWATAALTIQDAVDSAVPGDEIVVTNGVYAAGGRAVYGTMTNRVAVEKPLALRSVNGPQLTVIRGYQVPDVMNGVGAIRCLYLAAGTRLSGFTLTNGATQTTGDHYEEQFGGALWCESKNVVVSNCVVAGNSAAAGGGGAYSGTLNNCTLIANSAASGGATYLSDLNNCALNRNSANSGGGTYDGTLVNCTLAGNSAGQGGGSAYGTLNNCIVYFNSASQSPNFYSSVLNSSCTTPDPGGVGNITLDPELASAIYPSPNSPCRRAGSFGYVSGVDKDGEPWANPPSIGCDEYHAGEVTGALAVSISANLTNVATNFAVALTAWIEGRTSTSVWDFGDGTVVSNRPFASHAWKAPGDYPVTLIAYNDNHATGVSNTLTIHVIAGTHYVAANSTNPAPPFATWATAATNIQDAIDAAITPGSLVLVSNGVYDTGGRGNTRVVVERPISLRSINGPQATVIRGEQASSWIRCVYLTNGASLSGFTLTNGGQYQGAYGAGVLCEPDAVVSNCVIVGNWAYYYGRGGGVYGGTLNNCVLTGNRSTGPGGSPIGWGGGSFLATLNNCTITGNLSDRGGGDNGSVLNNCIVYSNTATAGPNYYASTLDFCCTTPYPGGIGNITNEPLFLNVAGGDFRLQSSSPCINAGRNAYAPGSPDLDGNPRIVGGTVDIGAYEFQSPQSVISYAWLQQFGLPADGSVDFTDPDGEGYSNWQEWRCQTDPTNALSALRLLSPVYSPTNVTVSWQSVPGVTYFLQRSRNLASSSFTPLAGNLPGQADATTSYTDTNGINAGFYFYQVGVAP